MFYMVALVLVYYCFFGDLQYMGPLFSVFGSCYVRMEGGQYTWIHYTLMWQVNTRIMPMSTRDALFVLIEQQVNEKASGIYHGLCIQTSCIRVSVYRHSSTGWHTSALDIPCWWTIFDASILPRSYGLEYVIYVMSQHDNGYSIFLYTSAESLDKYFFWWRYCGIYYTWNDLGPCSSVGILWHIKVKLNYGDGCPPTWSYIVNYYWLWSSVPCGGTWISENFSWILSITEIFYGDTLTHLFLRLQRWGRSCCHSATYHARRDACFPLFHPTIPVWGRAVEWYAW